MNRVTTFIHGVDKIQIEIDQDSPRCIYLRLDGEEIAYYDMHVFKEPEGEKIPALMLNGVLVPPPEPTEPNEKEDA